MAGLPHCLKSCKQVTAKCYFTGENSISCPMAKMRMISEIILQCVHRSLFKTIKRLIWPPLKPKAEIYFSPNSADWFIGIITQV